MSILVQNAPADRGASRGRRRRAIGAAVIAATLVFGVAAPASASPASASSPGVAAAPSIRPTFVDVAWDFYNPNCAWKKLHTRYSVTGLQYTVHNYLGSGKYRSNSYVWQATVGYLQYSSRISTCK